MPFRPDRPHNQLAPLPPAVDVETHAILKACIEARAAIADEASGRVIYPPPEGDALLRDQLANWER